MRQAFHNLTFAIFTDRKRADAARSSIDERTDADVELLEPNHGLTRGDIPRQTRWARVGLIAGASVAAGLLFAAVVGFTWVGLGPVAEGMIVPYRALAIGVVLSAIFGALAGTLSLMVEIRTTMLRLRRGLDHGRTILFVDSDRDVERLLTLHGAVETGTVV